MMIHLTSRSLALPIGRIGSMASLHEECNLVATIKPSSWGRGSVAESVDDLRGPEISKNWKN